MDAGGSAVHLLLVQTASTRTVPPTRLFHNGLRRLVHTRLKGRISDAVQQAHYTALPSAVKTGRPGVKWRSQPAHSRLGCSTRIPDQPNAHCISCSRIIAPHRGSRKW